MRRWANLESLVRVLVEQKRVGQRDVNITVRRIHTLWRIADGGVITKPIEEPAVDHHPTGPEAIARWDHPRLGIVEIRDPQTVVEIFREVGGLSDQP